MYYDTSQINIEYLMYPQYSMQFVLESFSWKQLGSY